MAYAKTLFFFLHLFSENEVLTNWLRCRNRLKVQLGICIPRTFSVLVGQWHLPRRATFKTIKLWHLYQVRPSSSLVPKRKPSQPCLELLVGWIWDVLRANETHWATSICCVEPQSLPWMWLQHFHKCRADKKNLSTFSQCKAICTLIVSSFWSWVQIAFSFAVWSFLWFVGNCFHQGFFLSNQRCLLMDD